MLERDGTTPPGFTRVYHDVLHDWEHLGYSARFMYILLCSPDVTRDNFDLVQLAAWCKVSSDAATKTLNELKNAGLFEWPPKRNYVYLVKNNRNGYTKIGRTRGYSVVPRFRTLQAEDPDLELASHWLGSVKEEKELHRMFEAKRLAGEWFNLDEEDVEKIKTRMNCQITASQMSPMGLPS